MTATSEQLGASPSVSSSAVRLSWPLLLAAAGVGLLNAGSLSLGMAYLQINALALVTLAVPHLLVQAGILLPLSLLTARKLLRGHQEGWAYLVLLLLAGAVLTNIGTILGSWWSGGSIGS